jgi:hypothetical protein
MGKTSIMRLYGVTIKRYSFFDKLALSLIPEKASWCLQVPGWWYAGLFIIAFIFIVVAAEVYDTGVSTSLCICKASKILIWTSRCLSGV